ncbi:sugar transferase [Devosia sp. LjRoot16]|uniref:sugar transferase n=1 Tax=Devosia sp. LjRoot16 TaxID=3342271 RepID=UPI003ECC2D5D
MRVFLSSEIGDVVPIDRAFTRRVPQHGLPLALNNGTPVIAARPPRATVQDILKRTIDIVLSAGALIALSPTLLMLAIAIKLSSPGPVLFRQWRHGRNGVPFRIYKFRTMRTDACDPTGVRQVTTGDPGVTPLGRFMRSRSLDELPQLFNVLRGDMSLVGPRPHAIGMKAAGVVYEDLVPYYELRHAVRPGLSGWAQANGLRGPTTDAQSSCSRIDHDLAYIQNQSLGLDLKIIWMTIKSEFLSGSGN